MSDVTVQAMLVSLRTHLCRQSVQEKKEARKVEQNNQAKRGTTRVSVFYFQDDKISIDAKGKEVHEVRDALAGIKSYFSEWRAAHNRLTREWEGDNIRLLPAVLAQQYLDMDSRYKEGAPAVIAEFLAAHPTWEQEAPARMGALYKPDDFPSFDEVRASISYDTAIIPLSSGAAFQKISTISAEVAQEMERSTNDRIHRAVEDARKETWQDLIAPLQNIVKVLESDKPRIFASLLGNLHDMLDLAPAFNSLVGDTTLAQFIAETKETLSGITVEDLRQDQSIRLAVAQASTALLHKFGKPGGRSFA
jgi:hypothetical protein